MATAVRRRRGNASQTQAFTGLLGEISVDTETSEVCVHDGVTAGGHPALKKSEAATLLAEKLNKVTSPTAGHLASVDAGGNVVDSGIAASTIGAMATFLSDFDGDSVAY